jgi:hypothetical protein
LAGQGFNVTIAMCIQVPEGIVLGADSTASAAFDAGSFHYFNHNQKLFEIGEDSSLGLLTWGLGSLGDTSHRTLVALLADDLKDNPAKTVEEVAARWSKLVWGQYESAFPREIEEARLLDAKLPYDPAKPTGGGSRTEEEEHRLRTLNHNLYVGFCIAGYCLPDRTPAAFEIGVMPTYRTPGTPIRLVRPGFWGAPNFILRLMNGFDAEIRRILLDSKQWIGTEADLDSILSQKALALPARLPIRDAIDFVYFCIHSTIKALKFSSLNQICGGPIELAVITTDRNFRWVRHKRWDAAIEEGED